MPIGTLPSWILCERVLERLRQSKELEQQMTLFDDKQSEETNRKLAEERYQKVRSILDRWVDRRKTQVSRETRIKERQRLMQQQIIGGG